MSASALASSTPSAAPALHVVPAPPADDLSWTLLGPSQAMSKLWAQIRRVAPHFRTALLTGESGCAQEAVARVLHDLSPVRERQFLVLDPAAAEQALTTAAGLSNIPAEALLYLPEIERLSVAAQFSLLRLLRQRRPRSFGIVASARGDLRAQVSAGAFNAELASTLSALRIAVPALRERTEDLPMLLDRLLSRRAGRLGTAAPVMTDEVLQEALSFAWPGNLRQASAAIDWLLKHVTDVPWTAAHLRDAIASVRRQVPPAPAPVRMVKLDQVMNEHIRAVLVGCKGNKLRAAEVLGISRSTLYRMLETLPLAS